MERSATLYQDVYNFLISRTHAPGASEEERKVLEWKASHFQVMDNKLYRSEEGGTLRLVIVEPEGRAQVIQQWHKGSRGLHLDLESTKDCLMDRYYWRGMEDDIRTQIRQCQVCHPHQLSGHNPDNIWEMVEVEVSGLFPGENFVLTLTDLVSKWRSCVVLESPSPQDIAKTLLEEFCTTGIPTVVRFVQMEPKFASETIEAFINHVNLFISILNNSIEYINRENQKTVLSSCKAFPKKIFLPKIEDDKFLFQNLETLIDYISNPNNKNSEHLSVFSGKHSLLEEKARIWFQDTFNIFQNRYPGVIGEQVSNYNLFLKDCSPISRIFKSSIEEKPTIQETIPNPNPTTLNPKNICRTCKRGFASKNQLTAHMKASHRELMLHYCVHCDFCTGTLSNLNSHIDRIHNKRFKCWACDFVAREINSLRHHAELNHNRERKFACGDCSYRAANERSLAEHQRVQHNPRLRLAVCGECGAAFKTRSALRDHLPSHSDQMLFSCRRCPYECKYRSNAHRHAQTKHPQFADCFQKKSPRLLKAPLKTTRA